MRTNRFGSEINLEGTGLKKNPTMTFNIGLLRAFNTQTCTVVLRERFGLRCFSAAHRATGRTIASHGAGLGQPVELELNDTWVRMTLD